MAPAKVRRQAVLLCAGLLVLVAADIIAAMKNLPLWWFLVNFGMWCWFWNIAFTLSREYDSAR